MMLTEFILICWALSCWATAYFCIRLIEKVPLKK